MKSTVTLPDELFHMAEATAKRLGVSRSRLYSRAVAEFMRRAQSDKVTARLNDVYSKRRTSLDPALRRAQAKMLHNDSW